MKLKPILNVDTKSLVLGALFGIMGVALLGAAANDSSHPRIAPLSFLVLESTPAEGEANSGKFVLLKVCPWYGKISAESLKTRMEQETQELTINVMTEQGTTLSEIGRGDIISLNALRLNKLSAGSSVYRHLPSGGIEEVKR